MSELLSALILLSVSIAVAFILVYALPTISPPESKPWLRPILITAFREDSSIRIYLYNPHSEPIKVLEAWSGGESRSIGVRIDPMEYVVVNATFSSPPSSVLLRFDSGAWMEVRFE